MERHQFDERWRNAFADGEIAPDASVWTAIELDLVQAEKATMRKRIIFYQRLAAGLALIILAGIGAFYFSPQTSRSIQLAESQDPAQSGKSAELAEPVADSENRTTSQQSNSEQIAAGDAEPAKVGQPHMEGNAATGTVEPVQALTMFGRDGKPAGTSPQVANYHPLAQFEFEQMPVSVKGTLRHVELIRKLPAMPASFMASAKEEKYTSQVWASLGAAAGSYNPNGQAGAVAESVTLGGLGAVASASSSLSTGSAYSVGMNAGVKVGRRWVLQSGVNYVNQHIDYQSNIASVDASNRSLAYSAQYDAGLSSGAFRITSPYPVSNSIELVSIPVQAGWLAVDRKFGLQINTGISTDLFVRSTLVDESGQFDKFTQGSGSDSPIRPVNFSALFGTEMSYRIGDHYGFAIVPGFRYSLAPLSRPGEGNLGNALIWDIGFRLRYHFK